MSTISQTKQHHHACLEYERLQHKHLQELSAKIQRGTSIKLWMHRGYPDTGVTFCTDKPELILYDNGDIITNLRGVFVAGDPIYSMIPLFPKVALYGAGRQRVEITDVSDERGRPAYMIERID